MSGTAALEMDVVPTTLASAICAFPQLGSICSTVLDTNEQGSGLKVMRLVSKQLRTAMLGVVQGYTLRLDGITARFGEYKLLHCAKLSHLTVIVTAHMHGVNGWTTHSLLMGLFLSCMGRGIHGITSLDIITPSMDMSSETDITVLLSQLADACPSLQQLLVRGRVERGVLAAFGAACPKLYSLKLMNSLSRPTIEGLHLILPNLTHISAMPILDYMIRLNAEPYYLPLLGCATLICFDAGACLLPVEMWHALPPSLKKLRCALDSDPFAWLPTMEKLQYFGCYCRPYFNRIALLSLIQVLRAAPGLQRLYLMGERKLGDAIIFPSVELDISASLVPDVMYLHDRVSSGLVVASHLVTREVRPGLCLSLWDNSEGGPGRKAARFMASLPSLPAVLGLYLDARESVSNAEEYDSPTITSLIAPKFPNLTHLFVAGGNEFGLQNLVHLGYCTSLQCLSFDSSLVTGMQLAALCRSLVSLNMLQVSRCDFSVHDGVQLEAILRDWGLNICVDVSPLHV